MQVKLDEPHMVHGVFRTCPGSIRVSRVIKLHIVNLVVLFFLFFLSKSDHIDTQQDGEVFSDRVSAGNLYTTIPSKTVFCVPTSRRVRRNK